MIKEAEREFEGATLSGEARREAPAQAELRPTCTGFCCVRPDRGGRICLGKAAIKSMIWHDESGIQLAINGIETILCGYFIHAPCAFECKRG
jgi:hypothetical protein